MQSISRFHHPTVSPSVCDRTSLASVLWTVEQTIYVLHLGPSERCAGKESSATLEPLVGLRCSIKLVPAIERLCCGFQMSTCSIRTLERYLRLAITLSLLSPFSFPPAPSQSLFALPCFCVRFSQLLFLHASPVQLSYYPFDCEPWRSHLFPNTSRQTLSLFSSSFHHILCPFLCPLLCSASPHLRTLPFNQARGLPVEDSPFLTIPRLQFELARLANFETLPCSNSAPIFDS